MTSSSSVEALQLLCRLCGYKTTPDKRLDVFDTIGTTLNIQSKISELLGIHVDKNDCFPRVVCITCIEKLDKLCEFRTRCYETKAMLEDVLSKLQSQVNRKNNLGQDLVVPPQFYVLPSLNQTQIQPMNQVPAILPAPIQQPVALPKPFLVQEPIANTGSYVMLPHALIQINNPSLPLFQRPVKQPVPIAPKVIAENNSRITPVVDISPVRSAVNFQTPETLNQTTVVSQVNALIDPNNTNRQDPVVDVRPAYSSVNFQTPNTPTRTKVAPKVCKRKSQQVPLLDSSVDFQTPNTPTRTKVARKVCKRKSRQVPLLDSSVDFQTPNTPTRTKVARKVYKRKSRQVPLLDSAVNFQTPETLNQTTVVSQVNALIDRNNTNQDPVVDVSPIHSAVNFQTPKTPTKTKYAPKVYANRKKSHQIPLFDAFVDFQTSESLNRTIVVSQVNTPLGNNNTHSDPLVQVSITHSKVTTQTSKTPTRTAVSNVPVGKNNTLSAHVNPAHSAVNFQAPESPDETAVTPEINAPIEGSNVSNTDTLCPIPVDNRTTDSLFLYKCSSCDVLFTSKQETIKHVNSVHPTSETTVGHVNSKHSSSERTSDNTETTMEKASAVCNICQQDLLSKSKLQQHVKTHMINGLYPCKLCKNLHRTYAQLNKHMQGHNTYVCMFCKQEFKGKSSHDKHVRKVHSNASKQYLCLICNASFSSETQLDFHKCNHTVITFLCNVCHLTFRNKRSLAQHLILHETGSLERPSSAKNESPLQTLYECDFCKRKLRNKEALTLHILAEHLS